MEDEEGVATLAIGFFRSKSHQGRFPSVHENVALYLDGRTDEQIDNTTSHSFFFRLPPINNADRLRCRDQPKVQYRCLQTSILLDNIFVHFASVTSTTFCVAPSILWAVFLNQPQSTFASVRSTRRILRAVFFNQCTSSSPSSLWSSKWRTCTHWIIPFGTWSINCFTGRISRMRWRFSNREAEACQAVLEGLENATECLVPFI